MFYYAVVNLLRIVIHYLKYSKSVQNVVIHYIFSESLRVVNSLQIVNSLRVLFLVCWGPLGESPRQTKPKKGPKRKVHEFRPFFCEFWCFSLGKQARFTLNFCSGTPLRKVHELTFFWFGLPGPLLIKQTILTPNVLVFQKPGNHPNFEKNALGVERPFSEQLSEFRGILGAILGMALTT